MSEKGRQKRFERLVKKANRQLLAPTTPHDQKLWKKGTSRANQPKGEPDEVQYR